MLNEMPMFNIALAPLLVLYSFGKLFMKKLCLKFLSNSVCIRKNSSILFAVSWSHGIIEIASIGKCELLKMVLKYFSSFFSSSVMTASLIARRNSKIRLSA